MVRSEGLPVANCRNVRQRIARIAPRPRPDQHRYFLLQENQNQREMEYAVPGGGLQYSESPQLRVSKRDRFLRRELQLLGRSRELHGHAFPANSVRAKAVILAAGYHRPAP